MLESTEKGGIRNSIRNCLTVFQNDPLLSGAIAKNLLTERTDIIKPIGYHRTGTGAKTCCPKFSSWCWGSSLPAARSSCFRISPPI